MAGCAATGCWKACCAARSEGGGAVEKDRTGPVSTAHTRALRGFRLHSQYSSATPLIAAPSKHTPVQPAQAYMAVAPIEPLALPIE